MGWQMLKPAGLGVLAVVIAAGAGYVPTSRMSGDEGITAMGVGCLVGLVSNWIGLAATAGSFRGDPARRPLAILLGTTIRFLVVLAFAVAGALSGLMQTGPLFMWISISYLIVLLIDTVWLVQQSNADLRKTSS